MTYFLRGIPRIASLRFGANFFHEIEEAAVLWKIFFLFSYSTEKEPSSSWIEIGATTNWNYTRSKNKKKGKHADSLTGYFCKVKVSLLSVKES